MSRITGTAELKHITILLTITVIAFPLMHEYTHKEVAQNYGCQAEIHPLPNFEEGYWMATTYNCPANMPEQQRQQHHLAQQTVESAGYQIIFIGSTIIILLYFYHQTTQNKLDKITQHQNRRHQNQLKNQEWKTTG